MSYTYVDSTTQSGDTLTHTVTMPTFQAGDIVLVAFWLGNSSMDSAPPEFTKAPASLAVPGYEGGHLYYRVMEAGDASSYDWSHGSSQEFWCAGAVCYRPIGESAAIAVYAHDFGSPAYANEDEIICPSVSTVGSIVVNILTYETIPFVSQIGTTSDLEPPTEMTEREDVDTTVEYEPGSYWESHVAIGDVVGDTGPFTWTVNDPPGDLIGRAYTITLGQAFIPCEADIIN